MGDLLEWYFPVSQAADILGCQTRDVYRLASIGSLTYISLPGRGIRISEKSMNRTLAISTGNRCEEAKESWEM